jgi:hypothetical protein
MMHPRTRRALLALLLPLLATAPLAASSYVLVTDEALADRAPFAAVVRVLAADPTAGGEGLYTTDYRIEVEEALKGRLAGELRLRVPGGDGPGGFGGFGGMALRVHGAPRLRPGGRALLFLEPAADGSYRLVHFSLGAFHEVAAGERRLALRDLSGATEVRVTEGGVEKVSPASREAVRDFDAFARWVAARAAGDKSSAGRASYRVEDGEKFTLFEDPDDRINLRWFDFDTGGHVDWRALAAGQQGVSGGGYSEFQAGLAAWNAESQTPVDYRYAGTTHATLGIVSDDGINSIVFDDPREVIPDFECGSGGFLAIGGPFYEIATRVWQGRPFHRIAEADIVVNDGLACFFAASATPSKAAQELFAHELGHTLGLGHACGDGAAPPCSASATLDGALMRSYVHDDGRGAQLNADDRDGLRTLYSTSGLPAAPTGLTAVALTATEVRLDWRDNAANETEYRIEVRAVGGEFADVGGLGAGATMALVQGLEPATGYVFRVRASGPGGFSAYSNEAVVTTLAPAGPCVADADTLCLHGGRFRVEVAWETPGGSAGRGTVLPIDVDDSGLFWFFGRDNLEMLVKVLDGCEATGSYWVFFNAITNVEYILTVADTQTGRVKVYFNPQGTSGPAVTDTSALPVCPGP